MTIDGASSSDKENEGRLFSESDNDGVEDSLQLSDDDREHSSIKRWVWDHFKSNASDKTHALYLLCSKSIYYGASHSTGMLECHVKRKLQSNVEGSKA
jgi:hypothetical protein